MTPRPAVALNLAQLVARVSQSMLSRRNASTVVPACMTALAKMTAEWHTLLRTSTAPFMFFSTCALAGAGGRRARTLTLILTPRPHHPRPPPGQAASSAAPRMRWPGRARRQSR